MARKKSPNLTEAELRLMDVVWERGSATVSEVTAALPTELGLAYNTVLTTMRILEDKGYLRHAKSKEGRPLFTVPSSAVSRPAATPSDTWSAGSTGTRLRRWCSISCRTRSSAIRNSGELEA